MSLMDRIVSQAARVRDQVGAFADEQHGGVSAERFLVGLVRSARHGDAHEGGSAREVRRAARKRRRRLGMAALVAGPFAGVAGEVTDLYSETATVCDIVDRHGLELEDDDIAAHMLVLWGVTDDFGQARATIGGMHGTIAAIIAERVTMRWIEQTLGRLPEQMTTIEVVKLLWALRGVGLDVHTGLRKGAISRVARAGSHSKRFIARAEQQLGVARA